jgi:hypothetical protein
MNQKPASLYGLPQEALNAPPEEFLYLACPRPGGARGGLRSARRRCWQGPEPTRGRARAKRWGRSPLPTRAAVEHRSGMRSSARLRAVAISILAVVGVLAAPSAAPAQTTCTFSGGALAVDLQARGDHALLIPEPTGNIFVVDSVGGNVACAGGQPTLTTTNIISVFNHPSTGANRIRIAAASHFAPGASTAGENGGPPEIEIAVALNDDPDSELVVDADNDGDTIALGANGINANAGPGEVAPDTDILLEGVRRITVSGGEAADLIDAQGGSATGVPRTDGLVLLGGLGPDVLVGGEGSDVLAGNDGNDDLVGAGNDDTLIPGRGLDLLEGRAGTDTADYEDSDAGVAIDLAASGLQSKGGTNGADLLRDVENVIGSESPDLLRGNGLANVLSGLGGNDVIEGRGGRDRLGGDDGADTIEARDGEPDTVDCGADTDAVTADPPGVDALNACERIAFPLVVGAGTATAGKAAGATAALDRLAPTVGRLRAVPMRFRVPRRGTATRFRLALSEPARLAFTIDRQTLGRRARGRCRARRRANASGRACVRWRRVGAFRARGVAGQNTARFSGRLGGAALPPGTYRAVLRAVDPAGNVSRPARTGFRVLRRKS